MHSLSQQQAISVPILQGKFQPGQLLQLTRPVSPLTALFL
jgi:hypothetical protein